MNYAHIFLLIITISISYSCKQYCPTPYSSENTTSLTPTSSSYFLNSTSDGALISTHKPDSVYTNSTEIFVGKWLSPPAGTYRYLLKIDVTEINTTSNIDSVTLKFYATDIPSSLYMKNQTHPHLGDNSMFINIIDSDWKSDTLTWNNQPTHSTTHSMSVPNIGTGRKNTNEINITSMIDYWKKNTNYGMVIKLQNESENSSRRVLLGSIKNPIESIRPRLTIYYKK